MTDPALLRFAPVEGVVFDFHSTLVDQGSGEEWLAAAWEVVAADGRAATPAEGLGPDRAATLAGRLERIWEAARVVDPENRRDLDPATHRRVFDRVVAAMDGTDAALADALYETLTDGWVPYADTAPVLRELRDRGVRLVLLSNVGIDVRHVLDRAGLTGLLDDVVLSFEHGTAKPDPALFRVAVDRLGVPADRALMVGDSWQDDAAAAQVGMRALVLPRTTGPVRGLGVVTRLVG